MFVNHFWTAEEEDESSVAESRDSDLLRVCFADFDRISPLKPSTDLFLLETVCSPITV